MIFGDTSAWFACVEPTDSNHALASGWMRQNRQSLITTDYVVDETLTLLRMRGANRKAIALGQSFFSGAIAELYILTESDVSATWNCFQKFSDKGWSFTDCSSKVMMEKLQIKMAFAFDHHFQQFGSICVVPKH